MRDRFVEATVDLLDTISSVVLVLADIGYSRFVETGVVSRHPKRVVNVGIREQALIGVAAGFALEGFRPIVHSYTPFLVERPFEQIKLDLVHQGLGAILVSTGGSFDAAGEGRTHLSPGDVSLLSTLPGVDIHVPGHGGEVTALLSGAAAATNTVYVRLNGFGNRTAHPADGRVHRVKQGSEGAPTVLAIGPMLRPVLEATSDLDTTVLYTSTVRPLDKGGLQSLSTGKRITVVEPYLEGTSLRDVAAAFGSEPRSFQSVGVRNEEIRKYGTWADHQRAHGLDAESLRDRLVPRMI